jgi:uncharacterized SAM-binding protein YcdF (DUF218 family)
MPFLLKKILSPLFMPLCLSLEILLAGVILLWFTRRQRLGKILTTAGLLMLGALSLPAIANPLLATLEDRYPPLPGGTAPAAGALPSGVRWIVVLGGGMTDDPRVPPPAASPRNPSPVWRRPSGFTGSCPDAASSFREGPPSAARPRPWSWPRSP